MELSVEWVKADSHIPCRSHAVSLPFPCCVKARFTHHAATLPRTCHSPAYKLPGTPRGSRKKPTAGRSLTFSSHAVRMTSACRQHAATRPRTCRERHIRDMAGERHGNGMGTA